MSGSELAGLYSAIEDAARLVGVPCSPDKVWPILNAYQDSIPQAVVAFRVATGARSAGDLDCRVMLRPGDADPYALALSKDLTTATDHPSGALVADLGARCPIDCYAIDFGVVAGYTKTWTFFPADDMQRLSTLAEIPSMPRALAENVGLFARHGLDDKGSLIGVDHADRTVNVYFGTPPADCFERATIQSMTREMGLPEPSEQMLTLGEQAFGIYATVSWDSAKIERICYAVMTPDPTALPVRIEPKIERFVRSVSADVADRRFVYAVALSASGEYHKLQSYYQWRPRVLDAMLLSDTATGN